MSAGTLTFGVSRFLYSHRKFLYTMPGEWVPDALVEQKMGQTKREMMDYIEKNSEKIDSNLPVFLDMSYLSWKTTFLTSLTRPTTGSSMT